MPLLYEPGNKHDCLRDHRYDVILNQHHENITPGTLWICPDCGTIYGFFGNTKRLNLLVELAEWERISVRRAQKIMRKGD